jgi:hypothetical protein
VQWGAARTSADGLPATWVYVSIALALMWCVVWPAVPRKGKLGWRLIAVAIGAIPAIIVGAWVTDAGAAAVTKLALLQSAMGVLALGVIAAAERAKAVLLLLPALSLAGPVAAFVASDFVPSLWSGWQRVVPTIAAARVSVRGTMPTAELALIATLYAVSGITLFIWARVRPA